ncbi:exodeoxyribonuclease VII small subunit [Teredinibacter franksiae]|uniref:exodeoxyribonuclease VII small subunit n=1 Tax=Teredinibacter franksiae TaxID=2761453 RepID=UPI001629CABD|nr:exodeoxyribonuclease VII small subunit [Teredinibacter franksiae]
MATKKTPNFEKSLEQLESLVAQLESGELSLEDSLKTFEQGIKLTRSCQSALQEAEQKVELLLKEENGKLITEPFELDNKAAE